MRDPIEEYRIIKEIEDEVLNFKKENVKTYVISAGILYGRGEAIFNSHIQKAWLQEPVRLPYIGDGNNLLPTIHVTDLARMVFKVFEKKPERKYIFAVDNNLKPTQKKLISAISNGIGTGLVESQDIPENFKKAHPKLTPIQLDLDWRKSLLLDLKVKPSTLFIAPANPEAPVEGEDGGEGGADDVLDLNWHCKNGLAINIQQVKKEFEEKRKLRPIKILITGPPCSGKTFFGQQLGEHYNVPHIHQEKLMEDLLAWDQEKEDNYKKAVSERDAKVEAIKAQRVKDKAEREKKEKAAAEAKRKAAIEAGEDGEAPVPEAPKEEPADDAAEGEDGEAPEKTKTPRPAEDEPIVVKLDCDSDDEFVEIEVKEKVKAFMKANKNEDIPDDLINEAIRWRLNRNDCQNRGYVLDGYPQSFDQADKVFVMTPKVPEKKKPAEGEEEEEAPADEEVDPATLKPVLQKNIYPESVIALHANELFLKRRSKNFQKKAAKEHLKWETNKLIKNLQVHNKDNAMELFKTFHDEDCPCIAPTTKFFQDNKTEIFEMDAEGEKYEMFESMRIYIERFGRPYNYLKSVADLNQEREQILLKEEADAIKAKETGNSQEEQDLVKQKKALEKLFEERLAHVKEHMSEVNMCMDLNMRQFLMKFIIPVLTEGMIDVWKCGPLDPVDYLAEYIFKRSNGA